MRFSCFVASLILILLGFLVPARATTVDPLTLEQLVSQASFVGVIECETAGGIVAEYRVIEAWKGAPANTRFRLQTPYNYWEPQFPIALVGQRWVVTAYASRPPTRIVSTTSGGGVPLWWREIPFQYSLPLFQGRASVPDASALDQKYYAFGEEHPHFAAFRARVQKFLALAPEPSEVALMRSLFEKYSRRRDTPKETPETRALQERIATATTAAQMANALLTLRWKDKKTNVTGALAQGGGAATLKFLETLTDKQWPLDKAERQRVVDSITSRLTAPQSEPPRKPDAPLSRPSAAELDKMRALLARAPKAEDDPSYEVGRALETLTLYDPAAVARYLVGWQNRDASWRGADQGYVLGSYFAWRCGGERAVHLRRLAAARDPYIRVAGAVYLCFESKTEGMAALRELTSLPGDAGAWAALNLARRGDKSAMPRALQVFATPGKSNMEGVPHRNLQKRLLVLLSNSANHSEVPAPLANFNAPEQPDDGEDHEAAMIAKQYEHFRSWWKEQGAKIEVSDPWLPLLETQKVD